MVSSPDLLRLEYFGESRSAREALPESIRVSSEISDFLTSSMCLLFVSLRGGVN